MAWNGLHYATGGEPRLETEVNVWERAKDLGAALSREEVDLLSSLGIVTCAELSCHTEQVPDHVAYEEARLNITGIRDFTLEEPVQLRLRPLQCWATPALGSNCIYEYLGRDDDPTMLQVLTWRPLGNPHPGDGTEYYLGPDPADFSRGSGSATLIPLDDLFCQDGWQCIMSPDRHLPDGRNGATLLGVRHVGTPLYRTDLHMIPSWLPALSEWIADSTKIWTDGSYNCTGSLLQRMGGLTTAHGRAAVVKQDLQGRFHGILVLCNSTHTSALSTELLAQYVALTLAADSGTAPLMHSDCTRAININCRADANRCKNESTRWGAGSTERDLTPPSQSPSAPGAHHSWQRLEPNRYRYGMGG